jgi:hypothetical protein
MAKTKAQVDSDFNRMIDRQKLRVAYLALHPEMYWADLPREFLTDSASAAPIHGKRRSSRVFLRKFGIRRSQQRDKAQIGRKT